ncbi:MAG: hypothetical protein PF637_05945 [Spirochaetes bacterium]|jgi:hypothetical protein|nr:hypothetical protein [Spirochaetota bacterium]
MAEPDIKIKTSELIKIFLDVERQGKEYLTITELHSIIDEIGKSMSGQVQ